MQLWVYFEDLLRISLNLWVCYIYIVDIIFPIHFLILILIHTLLTVSIFNLGVNHIYEMKLVHVRTLEFLCFMSEHITCETPRQYMFLQTAIFRAVERGQVEFIRHLFKVDPDLFGIQDGKGKRVLSYAVECRQAKIYNLLYRMLKENDRTWQLSTGDAFKSTILHSTANLSANLNHIQGAALQMQSELQWFKVSLNFSLHMHEINYSHPTCIYGHGSTCQLTSLSQYQLTASEASGLIPFDITHINTLN